MKKWIECYLCYDYRDESPRVDPEDEYSRSMLYAKAMEERINLGNSTGNKIDNGKIVNNTSFCIKHALNVLRIKHFAVLLSPNSIKSSWLNDEEFIAKIKENFKVIPVLYNLDPSDIPPPFKGMHYVNLTKDYNFSELREMIEQGIVYKSVNKGHKLDISVSSYKIRGFGCAEEKIMCFKIPLYMEVIDWCSKCNPVKSFFEGIFDVLKKDCVFSEMENKSKIILWFWDTGNYEFLFSKHFSYSMDNRIFVNSPVCINAANKILMKFKKDCDWKPILPTLRKI